MLLNSTMVIRMVSETISKEERQLPNVTKTAKNVKQGMQARVRQQASEFSDHQE